MMGVGGIPAHSTVCSSLEPRGGGLDDTARIQAAINLCPIGRVVQLTAGLFIINSGKFLLVNRGIALRGAWPSQTILAKNNAAKLFEEAVSATPSPLIIVGPSRYSTTRDPRNVVGSTDLTADAGNGVNTILMHLAQISAA